MIDWMEAFDRGIDGALALEFELLDWMEDSVNKPINQVALDIVNMNLNTYGLYFSAGMIVNKLEHVYKGRPRRHGHLVSLSSEIPKDEKGMLKVCARYIKNWMDNAGPEYLRLLRYPAACSSEYLLRSVVEEYTDDQLKKLYDAAELERMLKEPFIEERYMTAFIDMFGGLDSTDPHGTFPREHLKYVILGITRLKTRYAMNNKEGVADIDSQWRSSWSTYNPDMYGGLLRVFRRYRGRELAQRGLDPDNIRNYLVIEPDIHTLRLRSGMF